MGPNKPGGRDIGEGGGGGWGVGVGGSGGRGGRWERVEGRSILTLSALNEAAVLGWAAAAVSHFINVSF